MKNITSGEGGICDITLSQTKYLHNFKPYYFQIFIKRLFFIFRIFYALLYGEAPRPLHGSDT